MTWTNDNDGTAVVKCDHEGCAERVTPRYDHERAVHIAAAERAVARGWSVPQEVGAKDYCAAHRPASTLRGTT